MCFPLFAGFTYNKFAEQDIQTSVQCY